MHSVLDNTAARIFKMMLVALLLTVAIRPADGANMYLKISGITGGSTAPDHGGWIDVYSMSHGISVQSGGKTYISTQGQVNLQVALDQSLPLLFNLLGKGNAISDVGIDFTQNTQVATQFYHLALTNVFLASVVVNADTGGMPVVSLSLAYAKVAWTYTQVDGSGMPAYTTIWNVTQYSGSTNIVSLDSDHDGLPDAWEIKYFNTLAYGPNDDPDHDGLSNYQEYIAGTNPNSPDSVLHVSSPSFDTGTGQYRMSWSSVAGRTYTIYSSPNVSGPYIPLMTVPSAGDGNTSINLPNLPGNQFYRVGLQ